MPRNAAWDGHGTSVLAWTMVVLLQGAPVGVVLVVPVPRLTRGLLGVVLTNGEGGVPRSPRDAEGG